MTELRWRQRHLFVCPCGYRYDPEQGDKEAGWKPGTGFRELPDQLTCPRCHRPKMHFRERTFSDVSSP